MKLAIIGLGYVGLANMVSFLEKGLDVTGFDIDARKINLLSEHKSPIPEPGIENLFNYDAKFATDFSLLNNFDIIFVCVNTPTLEDYSCDLSQLESVMKVLKVYAKVDSTIVIKSTVPVGTTRKVLREFAKDKPELNLTFAFSPEFLAQGTAVKNACNPNRIVIGSDKAETRKKLQPIFASFTCPIIHTTLESAELAKYACNCFLATKISFINEMANLASATGANIDDVKEIMGLDPRIGNIFMNPGIGYGGGCFVKDTRSIIKQGLDKSLSMNIIQASDATNESQNLLPISFLRDTYEDLTNLRYKDILFVGMAFKASTGDLRGSIALKNLEILREYQPSINVYDPLVDQQDPRVSDVRFIDNLEEGIKKAEIIIIFSEKIDIKILDQNIFKDKVIFDGRNVLNNHVRHIAKVYRAVGK